MRWTTKNLMNRVWDLGISPLGKTGKTLKLLGSGVVDQRQTTPLERPPPDLALQTVDFLYRVEEGVGDTETDAAPLFRPPITRRHSAPDGSSSRVENQLDEPRR